MQYCGMTSSDHLNQENKILHKKGQLNPLFHSSADLLNTIEQKTDWLVFDFPSSGFIN